MSSLPQDSLSTSWLTTKPPYQYTPLNPREIRLLLLDATDPPSPDLISCHLESVSFNKDVKYTAISYVWGDAEDPKSIICDGCILYVTVNLYNGLRNWRPTTRKSAYLWADAICINQKDNDEKSHQVTMMGEIYKTAETVWVWLTNGSEATSRAYRLMEEIYNHFKLGDIDDKYFLEALAPFGQEVQKNIKVRRNNPAIAAVAAQLKVEQELSQNRLVPGDVEDWQAISDVFSLPWFGRKWIIQEVVLAHNALVFCGTQSILWSILREVSAILPTCVARMILNSSPIHRDYSLLFPGLNRTLRSATIANTSSGQSMVFLLVATSEFECTDMRDRYFALHGLCAEAMETDWPLRPNYDLNLQDISFRFGEWQLVRKQNPEILGLVEPDALPSSRTPSWVPSFDPGHSLSIDSGVSDTCHWKCSGDSILDVRVCEDDLTLHIKGKTLDLISRGELPDFFIRLQAQTLWSSIASLNKQSQAPLVLSNLSSHHEETLENLPLIRLLQPAIRFRHMLRELVGKAHELGTETSTKMQRALVDTLTFDIFDPELKPDSESRKIFLEVLREILQGKPRPGTELRQLMNDPKFYALYEGLVSESRYYCATEKDMITVVPKASLVGDRICIFYGCRTPFVIRPEGDGMYRLVGPCFVYGMMGGEGMKMGELEERIFVLQ